MALIECWKHGAKVLPTTKCDHFEKGEVCGDHPNCFYTTRVARYQYLNRIHNPVEEVDEVEEEKQVVNVDDEFW